MHMETENTLITAGALPHDAEELRVAVAEHRHQVRPVLLFICEDVDVDVWVVVRIGGDRSALGINTYML